MGKVFKRASKVAGLPPGTLVHVGEKRLDRATINVFDYDEESLSEKDVPKPEDCFAFRDKPTVTWINVNGLHDVSIIEQLGTHFGLHPLVMEDILHTAQRPKVEDYDQYIYAVVKMLTYDDETREIGAEQVSLILGSRFVLSFQEREGDVFGPVRQRIRSAKGRIRKMGADYLLHGLLDSVVDGYFTVLEKVNERAETLQDALTTELIPTTQREIHELRRQLIFLRKSVWPLREAVGALQRGQSTLISDSTDVYLRDLYDHTIQVMETVDTLRDMCSGLLDIYLASISNRMNEIMKVLTIIASLFIPLTFIAGVYGMNFEHMPELAWRWSYPVVWVVMIGAVASMLVYFRKRGWI